MECDRVALQKDVRTLCRMDPYRGVVEGGGNFATRLGFPTANIPLTDISLSGIYAARVHLPDSEYDAVIYANQARKLLEAHLLDFSGDLYGKTIEVALLEKIREDAVFADEDAARAAITKDVAAVRAYFKK